VFVSSQNVSERVSKLAESAVGVFPAASDLNNRDRALLVIDVVDHAPVADADSPALQPAQFPAPWRARVAFQFQDGLGNASEVWLLDAIQLPACAAVE
jgi:hypothetical protein